MTEVNQSSGQSIFLMSFKFSLGGRTPVLEGGLVGVVTMILTEELTFKL